MSRLNRQCPSHFPSPQALKYAFQTHDRLCFVMEYANGGEVSRAAPPGFLGISFPSVGGGRWRAEGDLPGVSWSRPPLLEEGIVIFILQVGKQLREVSGLLRFTQLVGTIQTKSRSVARAVREVG